MRVFDPMYLLVLAASLAGGSGAALAQAAQPEESARDNGAAATPDTVKRDELLKPGLAELRQGDAAAALKAFRPALEAYPKDVAVLSSCAEAAMASHQDAAALDFFNRSLEQKPRDPWHMRVAMILLEARLERWPDFDRDQAALKKARQDGEKELASTNGYLVDDFEVGGQPVRVAYFPSLAGQYKTLYRFILPALPAVLTTPSDNDRCKNPNFHPYIDVESDDVDQATFHAQHPDLAARGERSYSLDSYPAACSQALIKFYPDGEPTYQTVRADVLKFLHAVPVTKEQAPAKF